METSKHLYEVEVAGMPLKLRSSHDAKTVNELVELVDEKTRQALGAGTKISFQKALLLASLHIAEDLILLKREAKGKLTQLEGRAQQILDDLEESPVSRIRLDN